MRTEIPSSLNNPTSEADPFEILSELVASLEHQLYQLDQSLTSSVSWAATDANVSISESITKLFYQDDRDGRVTDQVQAVVIIDDQQMALIHSINGIKSRFKNSVSQLRQANPKQISHWQNAVFNQGGRGRTQLAEHQVGRLHLKQAWRRLNVIDQTVEKIQFAWYKSGRSITKLSQQEVLDRLLRAEKQGRPIANDWKAMANTQSTDVFAMVQTQAPLIRANVFLESGERFALNASTPLFLAAQTTLPQITPATALGETKTRQTRSDTKIEAKPFLDVIRVHRYAK
ncbi:MAG: hypothetical protein HWD83_04045 [Gammaproteobacteria bacterium]|nr:hypothetical protein [Gammaproteobacteria bacterium]